MQSFGDKVVDAANVDARLEVRDARLQGVGKVLAVEDAELLFQTAGRRESTAWWPGRDGSTHPSRRARTSNWFVRPNL